MAIISPPLSDASPPEARDKLKCNCPERNSKTRQIKTRHVHVCMLAGLAHGLALQSSGPILPQDLAHGLALQSSGPLLPQDLARKATHADQDLYKINQVQKLRSCRARVLKAQQNHVM